MPLKSLLFKIMFFTFASLLVALPVYSQQYVLVGWNDLGMHCANKGFSKIAVLPPFNNVTAQLILILPDQSPRLVDSGYTIEYSIPNNTFSVGKTDFWSYAQQLFGLPTPLPPNIGLAGKGLTGTLDSSGGYFIAHGIPVTPYADNDFVNENPFQLIHLVAKSKADGNVLATTDAVIPVSNEVGCVQVGCHSSETAILNEHESVPNFNRTGPVLCASCHASNALGTTGIPEAMPFSYRIHSAHSQVAGSSTDINTCYKCHPGPKTQCLRDIMGKNPTNPLVCQNCHGTLDTVASSILAGRRPWLDEPQCGYCHGSNHAEESGKLFRQSRGHGGLFCSACHGSPHAIQPTIQPNDNLQNTRLQGFAGALRKCSVCHVTPPTGPGPHGLMDTIYAAPATPRLLYPANQGVDITTAPKLQWVSQVGALHYRLQVATDSLFASLIFDDSTIALSSWQFSGLNELQNYYWRVYSLNTVGSSSWSDVWTFQTGTGVTCLYSVDNAWNLVSLPQVVGNSQTAMVLPSAISPVFLYSAEGGYSSQDSLSLGRGYWVKFHGAQTIWITGGRIARDTIDVSAGWNLIGSISDTVQTNVITSLPGGIINSSFYGFSSGYKLSTFITPAKGYWVRASQAGKIIIGSTTPGNNYFHMAKEVLERYDKITLRDAQGSEQALYIVDKLMEEPNDDYYDLPPPPPAGVFDVRFTSNKYLEMYSGDQEVFFPVRVSSVEYPLTISWDIHASTKLIVLNLGTVQTPLEEVGSTRLSSELSSISIGVRGKKPIPREFALQQNCPNPFNPSTIIKYQLPTKSRIKITIHDVLGQRMTTLTDGIEEAGHRSAIWDCSGRASGIYFCRLEAVSTDDPTRTFTQVRKMLFLK